MLIAIETEISSSRKPCIEHWTTYYNVSHFEYEKYDTHVIHIPNP